MKKMISMDRFFELPAVKIHQQIQRENPYGSAPHKEAYLAICKLAKKFGAAEHIRTQDY